MRWFPLVLMTAIPMGCSPKKTSSESNVPEEIAAAFKKDFPNAVKLYWEREDSDFEAQFFLDGKEMSAIYDDSGMLWEVEESISNSELPNSAIEYIRNKRPGSSIDEASRIMLKPDKILYEAEVDGKDLLFSENGTFLKTSRN